MYKIDSFTNENWAFIDNVFSESEINFIANANKGISSESGKIANGEHLNIRNSEIVWLPFNDEFNFVYQKLADVAKELNRFFLYDINLLEQCQISLYKENGKYKAHKDMGQFVGESRKLTLVMQISNEHDYTGGELLLYSDGIDNPEIMSKKFGRIIAFPAWMIHEVKPVQTGIRKSLVTWVHGPKFK